MRFLLSINFCGAMISARCSSFPYDDQECMARSLSLQNLTAIRPEIVIDSSNPANNAVVFQLYNPATGVSGECAAHGATLSPDPAVGKPELWYGCFVESRDATISAGFRFDSPGNQLTVKETWTCVSADSGGLMEFEAYGTNKLGVTCSDSGVQRLCMEDGEVAIGVSVASTAM